MQLKQVEQTGVQYFIRCICFDMVVIQNLIKESGINELRLQFFCNERLVAQAMATAVSVKSIDIDSETG